MAFLFEEDKNKRYERVQLIRQILDNSEIIYFLGIGGIGISGLVNLFSGLGKNTAGVDQYKTEITEKLEAKGISIYYGHSIENIKKIISKFGKIDVAVYSPAITENNEELIYLKNNSIPCFTYGQALSYFFNKFNSISICGTHGKSSTTAILSEIFLNKGINISFLCGAILKKFDSNAIYKDNSQFFIAESCEYKETFLNFFPDDIIIPSLEVDHLDYYQNEENYLSSFKAYLNQSKNGIVVIRVESKMEIDLFNYAKELDNIKQVIAYSKENTNINDLVKKYENQIYFTYHYDEKKPFNVSILKKKIIKSKVINIKKIKTKIPIPSIEYAANFTSIISYLNSKDLFDKKIQGLIKNYSGIRRRFDILGIDRNSNIIISDYAHHPSEIKTLMKITQLKYPDKKIILIFQAHQHSRTRLLLKEFLDFFRNINFLILLPIYRQRDSEEDCKTMSSEIFYNKVKEVNGNTKFFDDLNSLYAFLLSVRSEIILFTGAGTIDNIAKEYLNKSKS